MRTALLLLACLTGCLAAVEEPLDTGHIIEADADTDIDTDTDTDVDSVGDTDVDNDGDGYSEDEGDCDDGSTAISPAATDLVGDDIDQNCDGVDGFDSDGDGHASETSGGDDCNDLDEDVSPSMTEIWYDGIDGDCGEDSDYDADGDGVDASDYGGLDCDDTEASIYPDAPEVFDGIDQDCEGNFDGFWLYVADRGRDLEQMIVTPGGDVEDTTGYKLGLHDGSNRDEDCLNGLCHTISVDGSTLIDYGDTSADGTTVFRDVGPWNSGWTYVLRAVDAGVCYTWGEDTTDYVADGCIEYDLGFWAG